jgi:hypothetical protein
MNMDIRRDALVAPEGDRGSTRSSRVGQVGRNLRADLIHALHVFHCAVPGWPTRRVHVRDQ